MKPILVQKLIENAIKEKVLSFFELGYDVQYHKGDVDETEHYTIRSEDTIVVQNDKYIFTFNTESKTIVVQDKNDSQRFYAFPTVFITADLLDAILEVVVLLGWR